MVSRKRKKHAYRSGFEDKVIKDLNDNSVEYAYEAVTLKYTPKVKTYTPDILLANGIVVELKGYFDQEARSKMLLVIEQNPTLEIRMVFQKADKKISKTSNTTYSSWCDKHGIIWAEGTIPKSWTEEVINGK